MPCAAGADCAPQHCPRQSPCCWALALGPAGLRDSGMARASGIGPGQQVLAAAMGSLPTVSSPRWRHRVLQSPEAGLMLPSLPSSAPALPVPSWQTTSLWSPTGCRDRGCGTAAGDPCVSPSLPAPLQTLAQPGRTFLRISTCPNLVPAAAPGWAQPAPAVPQPGTQTCPAGPMAPNLLTPTSPRHVLSIHQLSHPVVPRPRRGTPAPQTMHHTR